MKWSVATSAFALMLLVDACEQSNSSQSQENTSALTPQTPVATEVEQRHLPKGFQDYYYSGEAEISSYRLQQARYGELREGTAVLIYVTEPFSPTEWVKSDQPGEGDVSVLKLNFTRKFNTGIYPYSAMVSSFAPVQKRAPLLKVSASVQEWCGHAYTEMRHLPPGYYEADIMSYFQGESQRNLKVADEKLEDELWNLIKLNPAELPTGKLQMVPSMLHLRLMHWPLRSYAVEARLSANGDTSHYSLHYPELERKLSIAFDPNFPYTIYGWEDSYPSGFGDKRKILTTRATLMKSVKSAYWQKNNLADSTYRAELGLHP